jgi:hypothetical protein
MLDGLFQFDKFQQSALFLQLPGAPVVWISPFSVTAPIAAAGSRDKICGPGRGERILLTGGKSRRPPKKR